MLSKLPPTIGHAANVSPRRVTNPPQVGNLHHDFCRIAL